MENMDTEQRNLILFKKKRQMQHYYCPQTWQVAAQKWNIVLYVKEREAEFY